MVKKDKYTQINEMYLRSNKTGSICARYILVGDEKTRKQGLLHGDSKLIMPVKYDLIQPYFDKYFLVKCDNLYGILGLKGEALLDVMYDKIVINDFSGCPELASIIISKDGKSEILDYNLNYIIKTDFKDIEKSGGEYIITDSKNKLGFMSSEFDVLISPSYDELSKVCDIGGYFFAKRNNKIGIINRKDEVVLPFQFDHINLNTNIEFEAVKDDLVYFYDYNLKEIKSPETYIKPKTDIEREQEYRDNLFLDCDLHLRY